MDNPEFATASRVWRWTGVRRRVCDLTTVRRPARREAAPRKSPHGLARAAHDEESASVPLGPKGDVLAIGREHRLRVVFGRILRQIDCGLAGHALQVDVLIAVTGGRIDNPFAIGRQAWKSLHARLKRELR